MRLDESLGGSVYVDTNILYMYLRADLEHLPTIRRFLSYVVQGDIEAFVGIPVLDELFYRLLLARIKDVSGRNPLDVLRQDLVRAIDSHASVIENSMHQLMTLPHLSFVGVETADGERMLDNIGVYKLLPRDALHVAIMQRLNISRIASDDTDFDRVGGIERIWMINPPRENEEPEADV